MPSADIPAEVAEFLFSSVHTFEELATLLLFRRVPSRPWAAHEVAETLGIAPDSADAALRHLANVGVISRLPSIAAGAMKYEGPRDEYRAKVEQLASIDEQYKIDLINMMNANAIERMRTGALRAFSDAFVIGRKKDG